MNPEAQIVEDLALLSARPLSFVLWAFPWGEPKTPLESFSGPEDWQREILLAIENGLLDLSTAIQIAVASGHGVGKSALVAWLILWAISTFEDTTGVVTANTETQLKTKTWVQLGKWHQLFIAKDLFKLTATAIYAPDRERTWRIDMVPWSEHRPEAFAGLHNQGKRILLVYDEASAIHDNIWETSEGALTDEDTQIIWACFGNPTRNSGRFRQCFSSKHWIKKQVDSRTVSFTNKTQIAKWIEEYGEDSDFVRVRVRGTFPRAGSMEFISLDLANEAAKREISVHLHDAFIIGVDVARYGDDECVIYFRKGRDGRSIAPVRMRLQQGLSDTMTLAGRVSEYYHRYRADAVFVDGGGVGGGVVDRLRQLQVPVWDIQFGAKSDRAHFEDSSRYANKRAEMWGYMRDWLKDGSIPNDGDLLSQLCAPLYGYNANNEIQLEKKEDMKKRGVESPDIADALALTFAYPVQATSTAGHEFAGLGKPLVESDYNPFDSKHLAA